MKARPKKTLLALFPLMALLMHAPARAQHKAGMLDISSTWTAEQNFRKANNVRFADAFCTVEGTYDQTCINNALSEIGSANAMLRITRNFAVASDVTVPSNVKVQFDGGQVNLAGGTMLTVNGPIDGGLYQIFSGTGTVSFASNHSIGYVRPEWWGAKADSGLTDNLIPIQAAVTAVLTAPHGGTLLFSDGQYFVDDGTITVANGGTRSIWFRGTGMYSSRIVKTTTGTGNLVNWDCVTNASGITDLGVVADTGGNFSVQGIAHSITTVNGVFLTRVWLSGFQHGANLRGSDIHLDHVVSELCSGYGFVLDEGVTAVACISYQNGYGYLLRHTGAYAYPDLPLSLVGCKDIESTNHGVDIDTRDNVGIVDFTEESATGSPGIGIYIAGSGHINITGGNIHKVLNYGIQFSGPCTDITINGTHFKTIGATTTGEGIALSSSSELVNIVNCDFDDIRLSAVRTNNAALARITNNVFRNFGRNETAGNKYGVLLDGHAANKGARVVGNQFVVGAEETQEGIAWESGAVGDFYVSENNYTGGGNLIDTTNVPTTTRMTETDFNFADLPAIGNFSKINCPDCTRTDPCAGSGTGAIAKRLNGTWICN